MNEIPTEMFVPDAPASDKLQMVRDLANDQYKLENEIEKAEEQLKAKKAEYIELSQKTLPTLMGSLGLSSLESQDKKWKLTVNPFYDAKIDDTNRGSCFSWLIENGHGALIKHTVSCEFDRETHEEVEKLRKVLTDAGFDYEDVMKVHPQTLKAFVKEQLEAGAPFPVETFKVHNGLKAVIKLGKKE